MDRIIMSHRLEGPIMDKGDRHRDQFLTTSILLIDGSKNQRTYWAEQLKRCSPDYQIVEASDNQSGLDLYRSRRIDCVVLELDLPDQSGFQTLVDLVPIASRPQVGVIVLTLMTNRGVWEVAKQNGAYTCLAKEFTTGDDLDKAIQRAVAFVGQMPKEDRAGPSPFFPRHPIHGHEYFYPLMLAEQFRRQRRPVLQICV